jgi:hypothetical protein
MSLRRFIPGVVLVVVGLVVYAAAGDGVAGTAAGIAILGVGGVLAVAAAFYEIGASEDRDRRARRR